MSDREAVIGGRYGSERMAGSVSAAVGSLGLGHAAGRDIWRGWGRPSPRAPPAPQLDLQA